MGIRVGDTVRLRAFFQNADGEGLAGLTVTVDYTDESGNATVGQAASAGAIAGEYYYSLAPDAAGFWMWVFKDTTSAARDYHVAGGAWVGPALATDAATIGQAGWDVLLAAMTTADSAGEAIAALVAAYTSARAAKLDLIGSGETTYTSVVPEDDDDPVEILIGDDYLNADGRALTWNLSGQPSVAGGSAKFTLVSSGGTETTYTATISDADTIYVDLTDTQTAAMTAGRYAAELVAKTSGGTYLTAWRGKVDVIARATDAWA